LARPKSGWLGDLGGLNESMSKEGNLLAISAGLNLSYKTPTSLMARKLGWKSFSSCPLNSISMPQLT
jgi:hypothetical protein